MKPIAYIKLILSLPQRVQELEARVERLEKKQDDPIEVMRSLTKSWTHEVDKFDTHDPDTGKSRFYDHPSSKNKPDAWIPVPEKKSE